MCVLFSFVCFPVFPLVRPTKLHPLQFAPRQDPGIAGITVRGKRASPRDGDRCTRPFCACTILRWCRFVSNAMLSNFEFSSCRTTTSSRRSRRVPCCSESTTSTWTWWLSTRTLMSHSGPWRTRWRPSATSTSGCRSTGSIEGVSQVADAVTDVFNVEKTYSVREGSHTIPQ